MAASEALLQKGLQPDAVAPGSVTTRLIICAMIGSLGAGQFGYHIGVINEPQTVIETDLSITHNSFQWSAVVAAFSVAAFVGAIGSSGIVDSIGRRRFLVLDNILFIIGGGCALAAQYLKGSSQIASYVLLILSRLAVGLGSGAATVGVPLYLGEIAPSHMKGTFGSINQFMVTVFILIAQIVGLGMSSSGLWGWMIAITAAIGGVGLLLAPALLESPRWLTAHQDEAGARNVLVALRGYSNADADAEVLGMREEIELAARTAAQKPSLLEVMRSQDYRMPLIVACVLQIGQQLSGINAVFFYSNSFFSDAGLSNPNYGTLAAGAVNVAATGLAVYLIDRLGRKPLMLTGSFGMMISAVAITVALVLQSNFPNAKGALGTVALVFVLLFVTFFEIGLGAIPWLIGGEMLPEAPRATVMGAASACNWAFTTLIALGFPSVQDALGNYSFLPFVGCLAVVFVFTIVYVPETRGKTPSQVIAWFNKGYVSPDLSLQAA